MCCFYSNSPSLSEPTTLACLPTNLFVAQASTLQDLCLAVCYSENIALFVVSLCISGFTMYLDCSSWVLAILTRGDVACSGVQLSLSTWPTGRLLCLLSDIRRRQVAARMVAERRAPDGEDLLVSHLINRSLHGDQTNHLQDAEPESATETTEGTPETGSHRQ